MRTVPVVLAMSLSISWATANLYGRGGYGIDDDPPVMNLIRTADQVFVFPVATPLRPHRDDKHLRLLGPEARRKIVRLLGNRRNWQQTGGWSLIYPIEPPRDIGLLFRREKDELVLFFTGDVVEGTFNGDETKGLFAAKRTKKLEEWKRRYAQPELSGK